MLSLVPGLKRNFDDGFAVPDVGLVKGQTYESNVPFVLRFMMTKCQEPIGWSCRRELTLFETPKKASYLVPFEADVFFDKLNRMFAGFWSGAPLRILVLISSAKAARATSPMPSTTRHTNRQHDHVAGQ